MEFKSGKTTVTKAMLHYLISFIGFTSLMTWIVLIDEFVVINDVATYNYYLYITIAHIFALLFLAVLSMIGMLQINNLIIFFSGITCTLCGLLYYFSSSASIKIPCIVIASVLSLVLFIAWVSSIKELHPRLIFAFILGSMFLAILVTFYCYLTSYNSIHLIIPILPMVSALCYLTQGKSLLKNYRSKLKKQNLAQLRYFSWPFLLALASCCLLSSFFKGMSLNPYIIQSETIPLSSLSFLSVIILVMLILFGIFKRPRAQMFFLIPLFLLIIGLVLFATQAMGTIISPLGMILAAKLGCFTLSLVVLCYLARSSSLSTPIIFSFGLILFDGTLGSGLGIFINNHFSLSFTILGTAASICIVAFTLFYAFMVALNPATNKSLNPDLDAPLIPIVEHSDGHHKPVKQSTNEIKEQHIEHADLHEHSAQLRELTEQESIIAKLILKGETYAQIASQLEISERTVKFHAKNIYTKAKVNNRSEFQASLTHQTHLEFQTE